MHIKSFKPGHRTTSLLSLVVLAALAAIGVSSCTCDPNLPAPADYKIATRQIGTNGPIEKFTYYDDGRVKTKEREGVITTFSYSPGNVTIASGSGTPITIPLNAQGYITTDEDNYFAYTYDAEGHVIKREPVTPNTGIFPNYLTYNTDGNLAEVTILVPGTIFNISTEYEYYEKQDTRLDGSDWHYGKRSKNLVKEAKSNGKSMWHSSYDFDARGRVIREIKNFLGSNHQDVTTYTYFN